MKRLCPLIALLILWPTAAPAQDRIQRIDDLVSRYHDFHLFNGSLLVADGGAVIYEKGFGSAEFSWDVPNSPATRFRLGSLTKQFTAALVLQAEERGEIDVDAPITRYLPDYPAEPGDRITVEHLLRHTSGIPEYWPIRAFHEAARNGATPSQLVRHFDRLPLDFEPGTAFSYSNSGYLLLGLIIERATGEPYAELLQRRLLDPLGLTETGYETDGRVIEKMATGYQRVAGEIRRAPFMPPSAGFSAAMMYSTVRDLHRWTEALHRGEPFRDPETLRRMLTPGLGNYGYGLEIHDVELGGDTVRVTSHEGGVPGFATMLHYAPQQRRLVVAADNTQRSMVAMTDGVLRVLYGEVPPPPRQPVSDVLRDIIRDQGIAEAQQTYRRLIDSDPEGYDFREFQLNRLGYEFLLAGDASTAVEIFRLNAETYPDGFNAWDSLGEAYRAAGQRERAIESYRRSLELNAENRNAEEMLRELGVEP